MKTKKFYGLFGILVALAIVIAGCGESQTASAAVGKIQVNITDAPPDLNIEQVWLTVEGVKIHKAVDGTETTTTETTTTETTTETTTVTEIEIESETDSDDSGWISLDLDETTRFNLLEYQNGAEKNLAIGFLTEGKYTQIRLEVSLVEVKLAGDPDLKIAKLPSNTLKFIHPFVIAEGQVTEILFDFDALKSISLRGNGEFICKPVIKLTSTQVSETISALNISPDVLPDGTMGVAYETTVLIVAGGTSPYSWSITGDLPDGLTFDTVTATLSGTPTVAGAFTFSITVEDSTTLINLSTTNEYTVTVTEALQITTTSLPAATEGTEYPASVYLEAIGGTPTYSWALEAGSSLPGGLSLDGVTGAITGTPTENGDFSFTVIVTDSATPTANTDTQIITIQIDPSGA